MSLTPLGVIPRSDVVLIASILTVQILNLPDYIYDYQSFAQLLEYKFGVEPGLINFHKDIRVGVYQPKSDDDRAKVLAYSGKRLYGVSLMYAFEKGGWSLIVCLSRTSQNELVIVVRSMPHRHSFVPCSHASLSTTSTAFPDHVQGADLRLREDKAVADQGG